MTDLYAPVEQYVNGRWVAGDGEEIVSISPVTGRPLGTSRSASAAQVQHALTAAREAFDGGEWSKLGPKERSVLLHRLADLIERDREKFIQLVAAEVGAPISSAALHVDQPATFFRWYAEAAERGPKDGYEQPMGLHHDPITSDSMLLREPVGVVGAITAFNVPVMLAAWKLGPALASGCSAVLLSSPKAILTTRAVVRLIEEAGFPAGAVNFVFGPPAVTEQVVSAPEVDLVTFTGSAAVGSHIMALAAPTLKKVVLELGGKSPNIILPGTDIASTVQASALRFCRNTGQACGATTRTLVPRADYDQFAEETARFLEGMTIGDPLDPKTLLGPLITDEHVTRVEGFLERAVQAGATIATGGRRPSDLEGFFLQPTLVTNLTNSFEIAQEELFAPVGTVIAYDDVDEAGRIANDIKYHLNANVWGPTPDAIAFARRIRSGTVTINGGGGFRTDVPWGGPGYSGIGRENGEEGFREFFEVKHVQWPVR
ncbi:aldehyde dehydrogenase family protein [Microbacterium sp. No. 7]|uniref:aldehyde dehydrogenase family protein n=1 Tax=Microbacterium sp. No. 7 TaxID=1714373 RepID=UPI0006CFEC0B|nr:aldehyde dehydrogenase family protein [Microbacterium sp. No. 7]ALJ19278.1 betaine-aldehyde dehydrogenase [Microbacterium sp. No. 7]